MTDKAKDVHQNAMVCCQETESLVTGSMSEEELRTLVGLLDRVIANIGQVDGLDPCQRPKEEQK